MSSQIKTFMLLALLSGLMLLIGKAMGGSTGLAIALVIALVMNVGSYWFSDKIVLATYKAKELSPADAPMLHRMVEDLSHKAGIPMPRLYMVPDSSPNAFATGRNPEHAAVAVTEGLMRLLNPDELRGVLAHEIAHIANRDILVQSVAGVLATVVMYAANMLQWSAIFGGGRSNEEGNSGGGLVGGLLLAFLAPVAASLIQFAISRSREYMADATGASLSGTPEALASALAKLSNRVEQDPIHEGGQATAHMFIVNPFAGGLGGLFSTHPPVEERIRRLREMR
ncbi:zinc metalloprotease HtpX [Desulfovibrio cuneatus]|uniref:zinc metalloprotease HtpX n=1 Tax=Desulfovibrio cuneatus TaxID=159728 RepID=UPI0004889C57|nr:zinc metalloprotease HtpX [Desulfovibrio cuneatus]